jgi:hypothetical protein
MGPKWSVFARTYNQRLINNIGYSVRKQSTDNSLTIEILDTEKAARYTRKGASSSPDTKNNKGLQVRERK